jgi:hypothetical protein
MQFGFEESWRYSRMIALDARTSCKLGVLKGNLFKNLVLVR